MEISTQFKQLQTENSQASEFCPVQASMLSDPTLIDFPEFKCMSAHSSKQNKTKKLPHWVMGCHL